MTPQIQPKVFSAFSNDLSKTQSWPKHHFQEFTKKNSERILKRFFFELEDLYEGCWYQYTDQEKLQQKSNSRIVRTGLSVRYKFIYDPKMINTPTLSLYRNITDIIPENSFLRLNSYIMVTWIKNQIMENQL